MARIPSPFATSLVARVLADEASNTVEGTSHVTIMRVSEKLRVSLTRVIGQAGYAAMQSRALALARTNVSSLEVVNVASDGRLEGLEALDHEDAQASVIVAHFVELLVTLVGESATRRLVFDAYPTTFDQVSGESVDVQ